MPTWQDREGELESKAARLHRQAADIRRRAELAGMIDNIRQQLAAARMNADNAVRDLDLAEQNLGHLVLTVMPGAAEETEDGYADVQPVKLRHGHDQSF